MTNTIANKIYYPRCETKTNKDSGSKAQFKQIASRQNTAYQGQQNSSSKSIVKTYSAAASNSAKPVANIDISVSKQLVRIISTLVTLISKLQNELAAKGNGGDQMQPQMPTQPTHDTIKITGNNRDIVININTNGGTTNVYYPPVENPYYPPSSDDKADTPKAGETFSRLTDADYGRSEDNKLSGPREISNAVADQKGVETSNANGASDLLWSWGQFIDHDLTLTEEGSAKSMISVPKGDKGLDPTGTGRGFIPFTSSERVKDANGVDQQINKATPLIDASMVYGNSEEQTNNLREHSGGRMKIDGGFLPASGDDELVLSGDPRAAEQPGLLSLQTLFVREHNRLADKISAANPLMTDQKVFDQARKMVGAEIQAITYNEFLPTLIGTNPEATGYGNYGSNDGKVSNEFATAAYRLGHTLVSDSVAYKNADGTLNQATLDEVFFKPDFTKEQGIGSILAGQSEQTAEKVDPMIVGSLRDRLFGAPGSPGMDLASLNIQRGRDHGLPSYNDMREAMGMDRITSFDDPRFQHGIGEKLSSVYKSPDEIDLWVGGLAEKPVGSSMLGATFTKIVADQFAKTAAADANFYTKEFSQQDQAWLKNLSLSDVIKANSKADMDDTAFIATD